MVCNSSGFLLIDYFMLTSYETDFHMLFFFPTDMQNY